MCARAWLGGLMALAWVVGCDPAAAPAPEDEGTAVGGKADSVFGFEEGSREARAILRVANTLDQATLDDDVGLHSTGALNIVTHRPSPDGYPNLAALVELPFVKRSALEKMFAFAVDEGLVGRELRIATFNIRLYGINGVFFSPFGSETRSETIRSFVNEHLADQDVVVYQEIVDQDLFREEIVPDRQCVTYDGIGGKHQRVLMCHRDEYAFEPIDDDGDFGMEELRFSNLRPGVFGRLVTDTGEPVANIVGVHLKAQPDSTDVRLEQTEVLAEQIGAIREASDLPVIVIGDFNTHQARDTGLDEDDEITMAEVLDPHLRRVELPVLNTYRHRNGTDFRLDHAFVSPEVEVLAVDVPGPCNLDFETGEDAIDVHFSDVSDHCPVRVRLSLP